MKSTYSPLLESGRALSGEHATRPGDPHGQFFYQLRKSRHAVIVASPGDLKAKISWEHVSVHVRHRSKTVGGKIKLSQETPTWDTMCLVKDLFWDAEECVLQFHPPRSQYVNIHKHVLHLWKPIGKLAKGFHNPPTFYV